MGLLNYTTEVPCSKSIAEIIGMLSQARVQAISQQFDGAGNVTGIEFSIQTQWGQMGFALPINLPAVFQTLKQQAQKGIIPRRFSTDVEQARRVAWRIERNWLEAQLAKIELGSVKIEQVMLAYAIEPSTGRSFFEKLAENKFEQLALPAPQLVA